MARQVLKRGQDVIPVQIIHSDIEGTPTFTIQHLSAEEIQDEESSQQVQEVHIIEEGTYIHHEQHEEHEEHEDHEQLEQLEQLEHHAHASPSSSFQSQADSDEHEYSSPSSSSVAQNAAASAPTKTKSFYCPNCGNCYGAAGSLKLHIRACLRQKETEAKALEARKCNICGKIYNSISYLKEHILRHSGKAPRKCPKCYRKFIDDDKLQQHIKSHDDEVTTIETSGDEKKIIKEYSCSFCQKKFQVVFDSHFTKRRYACDECRDKFTNEENLKHHKESLEEKKEFRCDRCGRKFVFEGFLQRHAPTCDGTIKRKRDRVF